MENSKTAKKCFMVYDDDAVREVLKESIPRAVTEWLIENDVHFSDFQHLKPAYMQVSYFRNNFFLNSFLTCSFATSLIFFSAFSFALFATLEICSFALSTIGLLTPSITRASHFSPQSSLLFSLLHPLYLQPYRQSFDHEVKL